MKPMTRGPLSPAVYWRRRVFVLVTVVALVFFVVNLVRGGDPAPPGDRAVQASGEPTAKPAPGIVRAGASAQGGRGQGSKGGKGQEDVVEPPEPEPAEPEGTCEDSDIAIVPSVEGAVAGTPVSVRLTLRTLVTPACTWTVDVDHLALKITDGEDDVWSTSHCPRLVPSGSVVVRRDLDASFDFVWNARTSSPGCPLQPAWAQPGEYDVQVAALGGEPSAIVPFTLTDPAEVFVADEPLGPEVPETDEAGKPDKGKHDKGKGPR